ncbi:MAG: efflux RND transporter periplasmic adaptor subunit [Dysgonamonadaceae bacterium]|jgi:RND family efflux transporter MFP subunit|nr:efflux RND transporter periplasmic adaptor subunit [Dysgonamonadaceae bacterium]
MKTVYVISALLIAVALTGCIRNGNVSTEGHVHDENLQLTAYSADFEVFAEATPFVVGQASDVLAHFSFLKNFKPITEGSITASLIVGTDGIRQTLEQPTRQGIYKFSLQPVAEGTGRLVFDIKTSDAVSQIVVENITVYTDTHDAQHAAADAAVGNSNSVIFTKEQSWKVDFSTEEIRREPFGQIIRTTGQIQPSQGDERIVTAKTGGIVSFANSDVVEGKAVGAGQTLFSIDGSAMADNNLSVRFAEAESEYNRAKTEYERKQELAKEDIVSQSDLLKSKTEFANAEANYSNLQRNFSSGKQAVASPISGYVTRVLVRNGQFAEAGQPVLVVSQNRNLFIKAELQPKYFDLLGNITSANFRILDKNRTCTLDDLSGHLVSFGKSTDLNNPLIPVVFQVNNKAGLLSGSFVELFIKTQTNAQAVTVPNEAIVEEMGNYFVYVQLTPEFFEKRTVKTGVTDGKRTEITEGVTEGERVVGKGAILVKLAQAAGAVDAHSGHMH